MDQILSAGANLAGLNFSSEPNLEWFKQIGACLIVFR